MSRLKTYGTGGYSGQGAEINSTDNFIPKRKDSNSFEDSALQETDTEIISTKTIQVPPASLVVGRNVTLSDGGGFLTAIAQAFDNQGTFYTQNSIFSTQEEYDNAETGDGILRPARFNQIPSRWQDTIPVEVQVLTASSTTFPYVTETNLIIRKIKLRLDSAVSNVRLKFERLQDDFTTWKVVWENVQDTVWLSGSGGYDLTAGENTLEIPIVNFGRSQEIFRATLETTESVLPLRGVITDLGLGAAFYPYIIIEAQDWFFTEVPNEYEIHQNNRGNFGVNTALNTNGSLVKRVEGAEIDGSDDQTDFSQLQPPERDWGFEFTNNDGDVSFKSLTFKSADAHTDVLCTIDGAGLTGAEFEPVFNTIDVVVGDNTITFPQQVILTDGQEYNISIFAFNGDSDNDAGIAIRSGSIDLRPYFTYRVCPLSAEEVATEDWVADNFAEEAPEDGKQYTRINGVWEESLASKTVFDPQFSDIESTKVQSAIEELSLYQRGVVCFQDNVTETVITTSLTPVKVEGTLMASSNNREFSLGTNSLVYDGDSTRVFDIDVILDMTKGSGSGGVDTYAIWIYVNGVATECGTIISAGETSDTMVATVSADTILTDTDYIEVYIENLTGTANVLVTNMRVRAR